MSIDDQSTPPPAAVLPAEHDARTVQAGDHDQAADSAIAAIQAGLDRFFAEADRPELNALRCALARQIEADIAALDALADRIGEARASLDATFAAYAAENAVRP